MPGMTANYSHGGPGWNWKLREAVELLERHNNFSNFTKSQSRQAAEELVPSWKQTAGKPETSSVGI
jgi:hypothetical protein